MRRGKKNMITKNYITQNIRSMNNYVIKRNDSDCKYVEIFTHRVGSIGAPSRRTVFISGTNTKP
jgi:hypothetical protein